jgi:coenzyme F420 hydrogenase subunit beta
MAPPPNDKPEAIALRGDSVFVRPLTSAGEPPRSLRALAAIVENDLCHRCGTCVGICPTAVLGTDSASFPVVNKLSSCTDCELCVRVCPGDEFDIGAHARELFGRVPPPEDVHGEFISGYLSHATTKEIRQRSASGGTVSALLISLLARNIIDGALVIGSEPSTKYQGVPFIARSKEEILSAGGSKYAITPSNSAFAEILKTPGRYAIVGLPCQIQGFHKAAAVDRRLKQRVALTIGLLCHAAVEHDPLRSIIDNCETAHGPVTQFRYRNGKPSGISTAVRQDGKEVPALFPQTTGFRPTTVETLSVLYRLYSPLRCLVCTDATSELADIAIGDPWMPSPSQEIDFRDGYSYVLTRTETGDRLLKEAAAAGDIRLLPLSPEQARSSNVTMGREKKLRAFRLLRTRARQGLPVPDFGESAMPGKHSSSVAVELNVFTHWLCFAPRARDAALKLLLSRFGLILFRLNNIRRQIKRSRLFTKKSGNRRAGLKSSGQSM